MYVLFINTQLPRHPLMATVGAEVTSTPSKSRTNSRVVYSLHAEGVLVVCGMSRNKVGGVKL